MRKKKAMDVTTHFPMLLNVLSIRRCEKKIVSPIKILYFENMMTLLPVVSVDNMFMY